MEKTASCPSFHTHQMSIFWMGWSCLMTSSLSMQKNDNSSYKKELAELILHFI
jgi:hypothetical protein